MVKTIQVGNVFGDIKEVELQDNQTLADALQQAGMVVSAAQQLLANSTSLSVNVNSVPENNEVYLITNNQDSG